MQNEISVKGDWHDSKEAGSKKVVYYCTSLFLNSRVRYSYCLLEGAAGVYFTLPDPTG
jgi:hypothetical protein